jgi:hypothetical protein
MYCAKTPDPKFQGCPALMSDGRQFTDYRPRCMTIPVSCQIGTSSHDVRMFLTHNADKLMERDRQLAYQLNGCENCKEPYDIGTMLPEQQLQSCNTRTCTFRTYDGSGLGLGRDYFDAPDTRQPAFPKMDTSKCQPIKTDAFLPHGEWTDRTKQRLASPSGGF